MFEIVMATINVQGTEEFGISAVLVMLSMIGLLGIMLFKMLLVYKMVKGEEVQAPLIFVSFIAAVFLEAIVQLTLMVKLTVMFQIYSTLGYVSFTIIGVLFMVEIFLLPAKVIAGGRKETNYMRKG